MTREEEIQQLLSSVANILDDAMEQMDLEFHFAVITSYPAIDNKNVNHFISNIQDKPLEELLLNAIKAAHTQDMTIIEKGSHLN